MCRRIVPLSIVTAIALSGCATSSLLPTPDVATPTPTVTPTPAVRASSPVDSPFTGEAARVVDDASDDPVDIRTDPSEDARSVVAISANEVVRVIDSTRDAEQNIWYRVRSSLGVSGWVMGQFVRFEPPDSSARPFVVMPGGSAIVAQPSPGAPVVGQVKGGEVLKVSRSVEAPEAENRKSTWLEMDRGWVAAEFVFQPTCLPFNGNPIRVVGVEGAAVKAEPNSQAPDVGRLEGGEAVVPLAFSTTEQDEWVQTDQGWVSSESLFLPTC